MKRPVGSSWVGLSADMMSMSRSTNPSRAHMAILAMTGGGKTVAARRVIRELLEAKYPMVILDPHGDYLGFWARRDLSPKNTIKVFYPHVRVQEETRDLIAFLIREMTQGLTEPQRDVTTGIGVSQDRPKRKRCIHVYRPTFR